MSSSIGTVNQLVAVIQAQLSARVPAPSAKRAAAATAPPGRYAQANLAALIEARVKNIGPDDPQRGRKAFRVFLEAVLLSHFGEALVNDPKFFQMVDDVQTTLEGDAVCRDLIRTAIDHLLSSKP